MDILRPIDLFVIALLLFFSMTLFAAPLKNIVVFGDSLSDNGNFYEYTQHELPKSPPYFQGRFTNGMVWVEHLINSYFPNNSASHIQDYAFGGATVAEGSQDEMLFTLQREIENYLLVHQGKADSENLYAVWIGANNYLNAPDDAEKTVYDVNTGITDSLRQLANAGAKHILVLNLPDLGKIPVAQNLEASEELTYFSKAHNEALEKTLATLEQTYPRIQWLYFDVNQIFNEMMIHPNSYGFKNTTDTCSEVILEKSANNISVQMISKVGKKTGNIGNACNDYLFFDLIHPSSQAHIILAQKVRVLLNKAGIQFN